jgi:tricorn protease
MFCPLFFIAAALATPAPAPLLSDPALSPNHSEIAFVSGGDIWTVPFAGGEARLLVSHPATESRPLYSPDGTRLAFLSTRTGIADIYVLNLQDGATKRLTFDGSRNSLDAWSPDSQSLYFSSTRSDVGSMSDLFKIPAEGGTPVAVSADRFADENQAAPHPTEGTIAFTSGGMAVNQWWRKGHAHIDETRFTVLTPAAATGGTPAYKPLLYNHAKNLWPLWSADGKHLYFVSDQSGVENIWKLAPGSPPQQVSRFTDGRVVWPGISRDGKAIVFERDFAIWSLDPATGKSAPVAITLRGAPAAPATNHLSVNQFRGFQLSPDGKKVAFTAHGQIFAASAKDGGAAIRLTQTSGREMELAWAPNNRQIAYVSDRDGVEQIYLYDLSKETETRFTNGAAKDEHPTWSPDGKQLAFTRDGRELHVMNVETKADRPLATQKYRTLDQISWAPDGEWLAYFGDDNRGFRNVTVVPAAGGPEKTASFLANAFSNYITWSPDRTYLLFQTGQRTERSQLARIDLIPRTPKFREDQFRDLFKEEAPRPAPLLTPASTAPASTPPATTPATTPAALLDTPAKSPRPVRVVFEDIRRRMSFLPLDLDADAPVISPDGKVLLFLGSSGGQQNLYTYSLDELAKEPAVPRQLTSTAGRKNDAHFSPDGKEVYYLEGGRIQIVTVDTRLVKPLAVTAELDVNFDQEKREVFHQAWTTVNETYYDPKFHGANWSDLRGHYARRVEAARTPDEMRRVISFMIGELNSSHSGISAGFAAVTPPNDGRLGLTVNPSDNTITKVIPLGPADIAGIKAGEKLLSVDGKPLEASGNLDEMLQYKVGKRILVATSAKKGIPLLPISGGAEKQLLYRQWVEDRRAYVEKASKGRLGYVHIVDMSQGALDQLHIDLDTENQSREGVVIDIRNNNGGFVNAYALDIFTRKPYLTMTPRDRASSSARSQLGQRSLELPTVLVTNQNSLSDAEDFTEGYRTLKLGKVVGEPTAGWIIYTGGTELIDGSVLRRPFIKITANDGTDMELHPRPVDIQVDRPVGESDSSKDAQLDAAVKSLVSDLQPQPTH